MAGSCSGVNRRKYAEIRLRSCVQAALSDKSVSSFRRPGRLVRLTTEASSQNSLADFDSERCDGKSFDLSDELCEDMESFNCPDAEVLF